MIHISYLGKTIESPRWNQEIAQGDDVLIVVRPESIVPQDPSSDLIGATVVSSVYFGSQMLYEVELPDGKVLQIEVADPQYHKIFESGHQVGLEFKSRSLHVLPKED
jgi:iron(III) transport system ATP-binding protein